MIKKYGLFEYLAGGILAMYAGYIAFKVNGITIALVSYVSIYFVVIAAIKCMKENKND